MSDLLIATSQYVFAAILWLFVLGCMRLIKVDVFGTRKERKVGRSAASHGTSHAAVKLPREAFVVKGELKGTRVVLGSSSITIGRAPDSTLVLSDEYVSSRHARIVPRDGQWVIEDLGSTNGTFLGRNKVTQPMAIPLKTPITIGKTVIELRP